MVQAIKAYKCMKTTLKVYKSNMGTDYKHFPFNMMRSCDALGIYILVS